MRRIAIALCAFLALAFVPSTSVKAETTSLRIFEPCSVSPAAPCIEAFSVIDERGIIFPAKLTGRSVVEATNFAGQIFAGSKYEWDVPGTSQPGGSSKLILDGQYFPLNTPYCWLPNQAIEKCDYSIDEIILRLLISTFEPTKSRDLNKNYKYQITLKLPNNFSPAMLAGEGATGAISVLKNSDGSRSMLLVGQPTEIVVGPNDTKLPSGVATELGFYLQSNLSLQAKWTTVCNQENLISYWHNTGFGTTPVWSKADETIEMQTEGIHLKPDGSLNQGLIELQVPVEMAKCLWGVDLSRAVSASMSATYTDGSATQVISTKTSVRNNYYILSSYGFHYSSPLLKVKMQQDLTGGSGTIALPINLPTPTVQPVTQAQKKITITCIKNKMTKLVTGVKPVCPAGYKKK